MRILRLEVRNFKAVRNLTLSDLGDVVLIAGPNGCGKSCVLDAIRLLKSVYGGYRQPNEWQHFFSEFQINLNNAVEIRRLFTDTDQPVHIAAEFLLSRSEIEYIRGNARKILYQESLQQRLENHRKIASAGGPTSIFDAVPALSEEADRDAAIILKGLDQSPYLGRLTIRPQPEIETYPNPVLNFVFGQYDPQNIGVIDFHSSSRTYQRERIGGINVNIEEAASRMSQHALYNWQSKYNNVKSELAAAFVRDMLIKHAGGEGQQVPSILETLKELFTTFLPGKKFEGPRPGQQGQLAFPVILENGAEHDIDDLSSGEKELVYGYLRLRNLSPSNSIILLDEPELHLNPRIVVGLPSFYRQHLGLDLNNQLWMVTHSDAFLRDAFRAGGFSIFHMSPPLIAGAENQVVAISAMSEVDRAIIDLVGDIAAYRPGSKVVVFESSESASFDAQMTTRLFPVFADQINALSGDDKYSVQQMYAALEKAVRQMKLPLRVYAVVDQDAEVNVRDREGTRVYVWDVYHIENYLLEPKYIRKVLKDNLHFGSDMQEAEIEEALKHCAVATLNGLVTHQLRVYIDAELRQCMDLGFDPQSDPATGLTDAIDRVGNRVSEKTKQALSGTEIGRRFREVEEQLSQSLSDGSWRLRFRGRDILRLFAGRYLRGVPYEAFRDQILARMGDDRYQPTGMRKVVESILLDQTETVGGTAASR